MNPNSQPIQHVQYTPEQVAQSLDWSDALLTRMSQFFELPQQYFQAPAGQPRLLLYSDTDIGILQQIKTQIIEGHSLTHIKTSLNSEPGAHPLTSQANVVFHTEQPHRTYTSPPGPRNQPKPFGLKLPSTRIAEETIEAIQTLSDNQPSDEEWTADQLMAYEADESLNKALANATMSQYRKENRTGKPPFKALIEKLQQTGYMTPDPDMTDVFPEKADPRKMHRYSSRGLLGHKRRNEGTLQIEHLDLTTEPFAFVPAMTNTWMQPEQRERMVRLQQLLMGTPNATQAAQRL